MSSGKPFLRYCVGRVIAVWEKNATLLIVRSAGKCSARNVFRIDSKLRGLGPAIPQRRSVRLHQHQVPELMVPEPERPNKERNNKRQLPAGSPTSIFMKAVCNPNVKIWRHYRGIFSHFARVLASFVRGIIQFGRVVQVPLSHPGRHHQAGFLRWNRAPGPPVN
jgi:hypothetical protein